MGAIVRKHHRVLTACSLMLVTTILCPSASLFAQVPDPVVAGQAPIPGAGHHYIGIGAEAVNPADGLLTFDLPLQPPAGRQLSFPFGIHYGSSEQWHLVNAPGFSWASDYQDPNPLQYHGWSYKIPEYGAIAFIKATAPAPPGSAYPPGTTLYCLGSQNYVFRGFDGLQRPLALGAVWPDPSYPLCSNATTSVGSSSLHGVSAGGGSVSGDTQPPITIVDQSGTTYQFPSGPSISYLQANGAWSLLAQTITDRNGNQITLNGAGYKDTLGRQVVSWSGFGNSSTGDQVTISGLSSNITLRWVNVSRTFPENGYSVSGTASCNLAHGPTQTTSQLNEIDLPNGQKYTLQYETTFGRVSKIIFPDGGYVRYLWGLNPSSASTSANFSVNGGAYACYFIFDNDAVTDRYVSYDGTNEVLHQHFAYSTTWSANNPPTSYPYMWASKQTTVTSTDLLTNQATKTIYTYSSVHADAGGINDASWLMTQIPVEKSVVYQDGSGNTLKTVNKTWANAFALIGEQTILSNGQGMTSLRCYDANEQVTNVYEYGFQSEGAYPGDPSCASSNGLTTSALGPLRRQTTTAYQAFSAVHLVDAPSSVTISDGSNNTVKQTLYSYDQSALQSSGAINLTNPGSQRANATAVKRLISGTNYATATYTYFDTGQLQGMTDACGNATCSDMSGSSHTTTYSYSDSFSAGVPPGQTNAYLTKVTFPNNRYETFSWGYADGLLRSSTDQNARVTSYQYNDPLVRLTQASYPDGGSTSYSYNDAAFNASNNTPSMTETQTLTSSVNKMTTIARDGLGHTVRAMLSSDPDGTDYTDTFYDGFGRGQRQYNPYRPGSPSGTDGSTNPTYDALGRLTLLEKQDGSVIQTAYDQTSSNTSGICTTVTDEAGNPRKSCSDSLGRLVEVDEPGTGAADGKPGTGTVTVSGSDQTGQVNMCPGNPYGPCWATVTDYGTVYVSVNGYTASAAYNNVSTAASVASDLTGGLNNSPSVTASLSGTVITLTARYDGASTDFSVGTSTTWQSQWFSQPSFTGTTSGPDLTGGSNSSLGTPLVTLYNYNALGDLLCVWQKGTDTTSATFSFNPVANTSNCLSAAPASWRPRSFTYDMLSRLTNASNPESGSISYVYDANGNVQSKTAGMPNKIPADTSSPQTLTTSFTYDNLNRLLKKTYSDSTPIAQYAYDGNSISSGCPVAYPPALSNTNPLGHRTAMCDGSGATSWAHDINSGTGWKTTEKRIINGVTNTIVSQSNLGGMLSQLTYPSGRIVTYTPTAAARYASAIDTGTGITYAQNATYAPFGGLTGLKNSSTAITVTDTYNSRLQPLTLSASSNSGMILNLNYNFHVGNGDNGNVISITNSRDQNRNQSFTYDMLNRIVTGQTQATSGPTCWGYNYSVDNWGNRTNEAPSKCSGFSTLTPADSAGKNRISGTCYDLAGNYLGWNGCPSLPYTATYNYDAENRLISTAGVTYTYDGDGSRVKKSNGTLYWGSGPLAESDLSGNMQREYVSFDGKRIARLEIPSGTAPTASNAHYYFSDHLGSSNVVTDYQGTMRTCTSSPVGYTAIVTGEEESDFMPYGRELQLCDTASQHFKFTGKERDAESGLDNFGKRYFGSPLGRFQTPDPIQIMKQKFIDPQQWNMYSYARNNPLRFTDPTGQYVCQGNKDQCAQIKAGYDAAKKALDAAKPKSEQAKQLKSVLGFLGKPGEANGVAVKFGTLDTGTPAQTSTQTTTDLLGTKHTTTEIKFDLEQLNPDVRLTSGHPLEPLGNDTGAVLVHEGTHGRDDAAQGHDPQSRAEALTTERNAYRNEGYVYDLLGAPSYVNPSLTAPGANRDQTVEKLANDSADASGW